MKVRVSVYGTLRKRFPDYQDGQGMDIHIPDEATAQDLLDRLQIPESLSPVVAVDGRIRNPDDRLNQGADIRIFQTIHGG